MLLFFNAIIASAKIPIPTHASIIAIKIVTNSSNFLCPYWCSLSAGANQYFTPKIIDKSVAKSEKL